MKEAGLEISDEKYEEELKKQAESYGMELEKLKEIVDEETEKQMRLDIAVQEAITLITDNAVEVEKKEEAAEAPEETAELSAAISCVRKSDEKFIDPICNRTDQPRGAEL